MALWDAKTGEEVLNNEHAHRDVVTDLQVHPDRTYFVTSSKDKTARVRLVLVLHWCPFTDWVDEAARYANIGCDQNLPN